MTPVGLRASMVGALLLTTLSSALAQDGWTLGSPTAGHRIVGGHSQQSYVARPSLTLRETLEGEIDRAALARVPMKSLIGIDEPRHGFSRLDVYFDRLQGPGDEPFRRTSSATLRLVVATRTSQGDARWWTLQPAGGSSASDRRLPFDPLVVSDEPHATENVRFATPDPTTPIVDVQYFAAGFGANTDSAAERHLLLDLRQRDGKVMAIVDTISYSCGGACTAYMCVYSTGAETGCRWDAAHDDFLCATTLHRGETAWAERRGTRYFHLVSGERVPSPHAPAAGHLDPSAPSEYPSAVAGDRVTVDRYGEISLVATPLIGEKLAWVAAAPSLSSHFGVRFFSAAIESRPRGRSLDVRRDALTEIAARLDLRRVSFDPAVTQPLTETVAPVNHADDTSASELPAYTPDGVPPELEARTIVKGPDLTILQVTVSEGRARGVYLVGLELASGRLVSDAMLVATDGASYFECNTFLRPATAVAMTITAEPFTAMFDVEPPHRQAIDQTVLEAIDEKTRCPAKVTVGWERGQGFALASRELRCHPKAPRRHVAIAPDGRLSVAAGPPPPVPR